MNWLGLNAGARVGCRGATTPLNPRLQVRHQIADTSTGDADMRRAVSVESSHLEATRGEAEVLSRLLLCQQVVIFVGILHQLTPSLRGDL